ncbi:MAG: hypothetical protein WD557_18445 [Dehalococcoidia bacterium]
MTSIKTAVSFPEELFLALERQARAEGLPRSTLVQRAVNAYLARAAATQVTRRLNENEAARSQDEREQEASELSAWRRLAARAVEVEDW